ncbi:MAG: serine/threonine protein kinase, partial [Chitinophagaceae bacterium]|nr:serine/threonine protein kinase [Rubrivivax sp.]
MNFGHLTPQQVLDALDAVGLRGDGRILQLNSYENRVFQVMLEDGGAVVAKFYRPGRWTDAQIVEEHGFALEVAAAEVPVVPPLVLRAETNVPGLQIQGNPPTLASLATDQGTHRFTVAARCAGRQPELDEPDTLRQIGRFIGRLHSVGRQRPFAHRHVLDAQTDGARARDLLLNAGFVSDAEVPAWRQACDEALAATVAAFADAAPRATVRLPKMPKLPTVPKGFPPLKLPTLKCPPGFTQEGDL